MDTNDLEWRCLDCGETAEPTSYDYMRLIHHRKGHHVALVNKSTGEVVAKTPNQARKKGIMLVSRGDSKSPWELTEEGITLPVTLPPTAFAIFNGIKAAKLEDDNMDFDSWLLKCIMKTCELYYKMELALVPIEQ